MVNRTLARRYATAVHSLAAQAGAVDRIGKDLTRIVTSIENDEAAKQFFLAPIFNRYEKERVLTKAFEGRVDDIAFHTLLLLVRKHREPLLGAVLEEYGALEMADRGLEPLTIASARPIPKRALATIRERLERIYGKRFDMKLVVDPRLVGGMRVTMGDRRVDGSIAGRLDQLARALASTV